jgi:hypothetical protein
MKTTKLISVFSLFGMLLVGCGNNSQGVNEFLGLKFGTALTHPIKIGPREPPAFYGDLREFYEITFPNQEFSFVGVALTKNTADDEKEGLFFEKEGMVWAAFLNQNKFNCTESDANKLKKYIEKNYGAKVTKEDKSALPTPKGGVFTQIYIYLYSPNVTWQISCTDGEFGNKSLVIRDYSVIKKSGNPKIKELIDNSMKEAMEILKRKIE